MSRFWDWLLGENAGPANPIVPFTMTSEAFDAHERRPLVPKPKPQPLQLASEDALGDMLIMESQLAFLKNADARRTEAELRAAYASGDQLLVWIEQEIAKDYRGG